MAKVTITNTARGLRGVNTDSGLVYIEPGATETLDVSGGNLKSAQARSYFKFDGKADESADAGPEGDGLDDKSVGDLDKIIAAEGVTLPESGSGRDGGIVKADKVAAIRAHRAAPATPVDELDGMDDETLRATVQAITGDEAPADATRETLLGLARGTANS